MVEPQELLGHIRCELAKDGNLRGMKVIVTAGGTQEPIDPVRAITNRSSGKQGFALAQAALDRGAEVILIAGPTQLPTPVGASRVDVQTAEQMLVAVMNALPKADVLIMAAAVADFRPASPAAQKFKREKGLPQLILEAIPHILGNVTVVKAATGFPRVMVGFAAESQDVLSNARQMGGMAEIRYVAMAKSTVVQLRCPTCAAATRLTVNISGLVRMTRGQI